MENGFMGYARKTGNPGIRNSVAIIALMDNCNAVARKIAENVAGTVLITDLFGRKLMGHNHVMRLKALLGMARHPNVGGVILVTLHRNGAEIYEKPLREEGRDVFSVVVQDEGSILACIESGIRAAVDMVKRCSRAQRTLQPFSKLVVGLECGGSDFTSGLAGNPAMGVASDMLVERGASVILSETAEIMGAEGILGERAASPAIAEALCKAVKDMEAMAAIAGVPDIRRSNPAADNIRGGLSTLAEKALGATMKAGTSTLKGVVDFCDPIPVDNPGFYFMSTPAPACESMTGLCAGGAQLIVFNTGAGTAAANPLSPTIKMTGSPYSVARARGDYDVEVSDILTRGTTIKDAGRRVFDEIVRVADGEMTFTEILGMHQSTISIAGASY